MTLPALALLSTLAFVAFPGRADGGEASEHMRSEAPQHRDAKSAPQPPLGESTGQTHNPQAGEMAQLQARISQQWEEHQKGPKRAFVGTSVREYVFARYVKDWVTKIERVGNVNYPEDARRQGINGSLMLTVSIFADGRIESVDVDRSSGSKILDAAAIRIVELAAPYEPFPEDMRKKADILSIIRTWTFTKSSKSDNSHDSYRPPYTRQNGEEPVDESKSENHPDNSGSLLHL